MLLTYIYVRAKNNLRYDMSLTFIPVARWQLNCRPLWYKLTLKQHKFQNFVTAELQLIIV